ncbi:hypothetical protein M5K25_021952 [Dendrobium thyrsiflorum]|uniref:Uncharacterized protein n=1 Tax=Dendrobium thyrsiflorum TaxID=117978 RepID=A0ABD0UB27_DENTH
MNPSIFVLLLLISTFFSISLSSTTFTFINKCNFTVWPAILSNAGHPPLSSTGFELPTAASRSLQTPPNWSGRLWARTGCVFHNSNNGSCTTGETPPATLAEFSLGGGEQNNIDFYDVSLVDGFNLAMVVEGGKGRCAATGCVVDLNQRCPAELRIGEGETAACRSACEAFRRPEYCCSGEFASPAACKPTAYSEVFKAACPKSYSYAFDDSTSTFTCADAGEFTVTFCPEGTPSQKSSKDSPTSPKVPVTSPTTSGGGLMLENDYWLASLTSGSRTTQKSMVISTLLLFIILCSASLLFLIKV